MDNTTMTDVEKEQSLQDYYRENGIDDDDCEGLHEADEDGSQF